MTRCCNEGTQVLKGISDFPTNLVTVSTIPNTFPVIPVAACLLYQTVYYCRYGDHNQLRLQARVRNLHSKGIVLCGTEQWSVMKRQKMCGVASYTSVTLRNVLLLHFGGNCNHDHVILRPPTQR